MEDRNNKIIINKNIVIKNIKKCYSVKQIPLIQNLCFEKGIRCPRISSYIVHNSNWIEYRYEYILGKVLHSLNNDIISNIEQSIICKLETIDASYINNSTVISYFEKVEKYFYLLDVKKLNLFELKLVQHFYEFFSVVKKQYKCNCIVHGDLDLSNIICLNDKSTLIDFDESCLGPKGLDRAIFATRLFVGIQKNLIYFSNIKIIDFKELNVDISLCKLYIIKVIVEKLYLLQEGIIDYHDSNQKEDSHFYWLKMMDSICGRCQQ